MVLIRSPDLFRDCKENLEKLQLKDSWTKISQLSLPSAEIPVLSLTGISTHKLVIIFWAVTLNSAPQAALLRTISARIRTLA